MPAFAAYPEFSFQPPRELQPGAATTAATEDENAEAGGARLVADRRALKTDAQGATRWDIDLAPVAAVRQRPGELRAELSYTDPNGEIQT
ncbi:MAG TPA: hypothetical protein PKZ28_03490, partial [Piscinibacter sp.]|nr:hypothetical protein [Piscinibacter sp.]